MGDHELIKYLDLLRIEKGISIIELVKNIMSRRNYSRLLTQEAELTIETLIQLLNRLQVPLYEFALYVNNHNIMNHLDEAYFIDYVFSEKYQEANELLTTKHLLDYTKKSVYPKTFNLAILILKYKTGILTKHEFIDKITSIQTLDNFISQNVVTLDDLYFITTYIEHSTDDEKLLLTDFFIKILSSDSFRLLTANKEQMQLSIRQLALKALTYLDDKTKVDHSKALVIIKSMLEYHKKARTAGDIVYLSEIYNYTTIHNIPNENIVSYLLISDIVNIYPDPYKFPDVFLNHDQLSSMISRMQNMLLTPEDMYSEVLTHGKL